MPIASTTRGKLLALLTVPALMLTLSSCASSPAASDQPTDNPTSRVTTAADWRVAFAGCMRQEGVDMSDPSSSGGGVSIDASAKDAFAAAAKKCQGELGPIPPLSAAEQDAANADRQKAMLAAAKCLRENGIQVADPKPGDTVKVPDTTPQDVQDKCGVGNGTRGAAGPIGG